MAKKRFLVTWTIVDVICLIVLAYGVYLSLNKTDLIIFYGIRAANAMVMIIIGLALFALIISFVLFFINYQKRYRRKKQPKPKPEPAPVVTNINSEEYIRGKLGHFLGIRPRLHEELTECLKQMDSINEKKASLGEVRRRLNAGLLQSVADSLDKAESSIWKNMLSIINIAEIWDPKEAGNPEWSSVYDERRKSIRDKIKLNDDLLKQSAALLTKGTTFANDKALSHEAENDLEATIKVIDQLRNMSGITGEE